MPFRIRDLIISVFPHRLGDCDATSGGCESTSGGCESTSGGCESTSGTGTVGSCTAEGCGGGFATLADCQQSDEILNPLERLIDPEYLVELRLLLRLALARSVAAKVSRLETKLQPHSLQEVDMLEKRLADALTELGHERARLQQKP